MWSIVLVNAGGINPASNANLHVLSRRFSARLTSSSNGEKRKDKMALNQTCNVITQLNIGDVLIGRGAPPTYRARNESFEGLSKS